MADCVPAVGDFSWRFAGKDVRLVSGSNCAYHALLMKEGKDEVIEAYWIAAGGSARLPDDLTKGSYSITLGMPTAEASEYRGNLAALLGKTHAEAIDLLQIEKLLAAKLKRT